MTVVVSAGRKTFGTVFERRLFGRRLKAKNAIPRQIDKNKPAPPTWWPANAVTPVSDPATTILVWRRGVQRDSGVLGGVSCCQLTKRLNV